MEALSGSQEAMGIPSAQHEAFLLVAMPGLFMTLDAMERTLGGLLEHNPRGKLLLVGSLGLPGTQWADGEVLDAKTHAYGLSTLLGELMARGELCLSPSICVVLLGLGSGANAILNFATTFLVLDKFAALRDATRFLALVNPFPSGVPDTSLDVKRIKRRLKALKQTLERGAHHEQLECLVGAMFSAEHLEKNDRAVVLEQFWRTRQALELPEQTRPKSAPVPCSARTLQAEQTSGIEQSRRKVGVLDCMEGVLRGATLGALDGPVSVPVLLITSTRDALDTSGTAEHCRASLKAEDVDSLFELVSGNKHRRIKVYPVQAGRRRAREFDARKERAAERKAKSERLKRQQELNRMKRAKMEEGEILKQRQECLSMQEEDERSSAVGQHIWGLQVWASSVADAKERALELTSTRDASDEKLIEDQLAQLQTTLQEVHLNMAALREKARGVRAKNESLATLRARVETETKTMQNRVKLLTREQSLLNSHDGNFFDSDIWQQGVTQRMSKERFAQDIQAELTTLGGAIRTNTRRTMLINETLASDTLEGQAISMAMQKFGQIAHVSRERLDRMNAKTIAQELQDVLDAEAEQELKSADPSESAMSHQHNKAALIRTKPSHQRSLEEKQWVALDILINKDLYEALSAVENEELQLNDEYKTELRAEDVDRILELPREIQLALPHLKSVSEVEAHNLLITYSLECGEAEIAKADEQSQDHMFSVSAGETNTSMGHRILTGVAPATGAAPTQQHRRSRARNTSRANLRGLPALESPSYMWTDADSLDSSKPTLAGIPSVPRDTPKPLNLVEAISDVALKDVCEKDGEMAIRIGGREVYRSTRRLLGIQESRVHSFAIEHHPPIFCVDLKVVVTFTGCIDSRGFNRGRVSAVLRRNSAYDGRLEGATGRRVGYAPHSRQKLNLGDEFYQTPGTIMIQHCPRRVPLACSTYEVEVTALGPTAYEVVVDAGQCELCASLVDKRLEEAKRLKVRLKELALEQSDTWESVRLRERQYHVCNTLIEEADSECRRCQEAIDELCEYLRAGAAAEMSRALRSSTGTAGSRPRSSGDEGSTVFLETPAGRTRQAFERGGWGALTLEEQQWVTMDQKLCPDKYEWLQQQQKEQEGAHNAHDKGGRKCKKPRKNPAIDQYRFHREELVRILAEPADDLNRREVHVRKLLHKFHDDPQLVSTDGPASYHETHDLSLAERTRLKDVQHRTATEKEWISIDKVLNPPIWKRAKEGVPGTHNDQRPSEEGRGGIDSDQQAWECPFNRDDLLRIWAQREDTSLKTEDERRAFNLLTDYYGACPGLSQSTNRGWKGVQMGKGVKGPHVDIDLRLRCLQRELDRVAHCSNPTMTSSTLHAAPQRYPTSTLRLNLEAEIDRLLREQVQQRERKNVYLTEDFSSSEEEGDTYSQGKKRATRRTRRLNRRTGRGTMNIFDARKRMLLESKKTPLERDNAMRIASLGPGGCPACMSNPCRWVPVIHVEGTKSRLERIADELHFARISAENVIESTLPSSVKRDGNTTFRRVDFIEDLSSEQKHLRLMMKLHFIDEEFHEANRTPKQHIQSTALHGYRTFLWTKDARVALEREHSRLVARVVAVEVAHDILEWMLDGWHFGERPSQRATIGGIPSIQAGNEGDVRTPCEQEEDRVKMFILPPGVEGSNWDNTSEKVVKEAWLES
eukprot:g1447.t1